MGCGVSRPSAHQLHLGKAPVLPPSSEDHVERISYLPDDHHYQYDDETYKHHPIETDLVTAQVYFEQELRLIENGSLPPLTRQSLDQLQKSASYADLKGAYADLKSASMRPRRQVIHQDRVPSPALNNPPPRPHFLKDRINGLPVLSERPQTLPANNVLLDRSLSLRKPPLKVKDTVNAVGSPSPTPTPGVVRSDPVGTHQLVNELANAYSMGSVDEVMRILNQHGTSAKTDMHLLLESACMGHQSVVELLITVLGADPNGHASDKPFTSPLLEACKAGHEGVILALVAHGAKAGVKLLFDQSPLMLLLANRPHVEDLYVKAFDALIEAGADVNFEDSQGRHPVLLACLNAYQRTLRLETAEKLAVIVLKRGFKAIDETDWQQLPPISRACEFGMMKVVQMLLESGSKVAKLTQPPPLHLAVRSSHTDIVRLILNTGNADFNQRDDNGYTLLHVARSKDMILFLSKEAHMDVNTADLQGTPPLVHFARHDPLQFRSESLQLELVGALLDCGADVNASDAMNRTALHYAAGRVLELLLSRGAQKPMLDFKPANGEACCRSVAVYPAVIECSACNWRGSVVLQPCPFCRYFSLSRVERGYDDRLTPIASGTPSSCSTSPSAPTTPVEPSTPKNNHNAALSVSGAWTIRYRCAHCVRTCTTMYSTLPGAPLSEITYDGQVYIVDSNNQIVQRILDSS
mmetsp:Transcript_10752/g.17606  ORF Transcript_10752/g.17606 Transcript_10752/m.17606 type:complete len:694 (+) Transcript_10752:196-2277(+)